MKKFEKAVALLLAVMMVLSCLAMCASAEDTEDTPKYENYLCIGTSVTRGCGLDGYDIYDDATAHNIPGSYPDYVANALGIPVEHRWNCAYQGEMISSVLAIMGMFDPNDDELMNPEYNYWFSRRILPNMFAQYGYDTGMVCGEKCSILDKLSSCDLITIELGMGDVFYRTKEITSADDVFGNLGDTDIAAFAEQFITELYKNYNFMLKNYTKILDYIKVNNPNATVVIIGNYNMFADMPLNDEIFAPIGDAFAVLSVSMNQIYKQWAKQYGYIYADISNVETPATEGDMAAFDIEDMNYAIHPSVENGLPYIARQVLNALDTERPVTANITVDLGSLNKLDFVVVDNKPIFNYSLEGSILTIPYFSTKAMLLTVGAVNEDGTVSTHSYQLAFGEKGYTAYKIGAVNDTFGFAKKIFKTLFSLIESLWTKVLDFFGIAK